MKIIHRYLHLLLLFTFLAGLVTDASACPKGYYKDSHGACRK
jgi:hypothetical protein